LRAPLHPAYILLGKLKKSKHYITAYEY